MIFYFSGTGNSMHCAKVIAEAQNEKLVSIAKELDKKDSKFEYSLKEGELLGFAYPIYSWGPPQIVLDFIDKINVTGESKIYLFLMSTCGSEEGNASKILEKALAKKSLSITSAFSIVMPNNYVVGSNVYSKEKEEEILKQAKQKLTEINDVLTNRKREVFLMKRGRLPGLKTKLIYPMFNNFARTTSKFYANDNCTSCGLCEDICPIHTIMVNGKPSWGKDCLQCLSCINRCPERAIQYGKGTEARGRYMHPDLKDSKETT